MRRPLPLAVAILAVAAPANSLAATPSSVKSAAPGVVAVTGGSGQDGSAVRIGGSGLYVTSSTLVSRTTTITVTNAAGVPMKATRILSDAPSGLALLRTPGNPADHPLKVSASKLTAGTKLWLVTRMREKNQSVIEPQPLEVVEGGRGLLTLDKSAALAIGRKGGALIDSTGNVRGVIVPPAPGDVCGPGQTTDCTRIGRVQLTALALTKTPKAVTAAPVTDGSGFPAIPVTVGLGILLLASQLLLRWNTKRRLTPVGLPSAPSASAPAAAPQTVVADGADDFEITLKPRG